MNGVQFPQYAAQGFSGSVGSEAPSTTEMQTVMSTLMELEKLVSDCAAMAYDMESSISGPRPVNALAKDPGEPSSILRHLQMIGQRGLEMQQTLGRIRAVLGGR